MQIKPNWIWEVFFFITLFTVSTGTFEFFSPASKTYLFYQIIIAYDVRFFLKYFFSLAAVLFSVAALIPFALFMLRRKNLSRSFCQFLFVMYLTTNLLGHTYEVTTIRSFYYQDPLVSVAVLALMALLAFPSVLILFYLGFLRHRIQG